MLRKIYTIAVKEFRLWISSPGNWLVVFLVPFAFIGIFGAVFKEGTPVVTVFAVNEDEGELGGEIIELLEDSNNLAFEILETRTEAERRVARGDRMAAVVIPKDFSDLVTTDEGTSLLVVVDPARTDEAGIVTGLVQEALIRPIVYAEIERGISGLFKGESIDNIDREAFQTFINAGLKAVVAKSVNEAIEEPLIKIDPEPATKQASQSEVSLLNSMVPGFALMFSFFMVSHLGETVINERTTGTLRRLVTAPVNRATILLGKALPFFIIAIFQLAFVLAVCNLLFNVPLGNSALALFLMLISTALVIAGMGIMVASLARNANQAGVIAILIVLVMAAISGALMPQIKLPGINMVTPHYWAMEGILNVISRGLGVVDILPQAGILFGMAAVYFLLGAWRFKVE